MTSKHDRDELPIEDFDQLRAGEIGHRIRALSREELQAVLDYERRHAHRPHVEMLLKARTAELDKGAEPSPGGAASGQPGAAPAASTVSPATAAPASSPPPHGTPDQPGRPKGNR